MGFDIGFHAIDKKDIDDLSLYVSGVLDEITFIDKAVVASKARFIANGWGLGLSNFRSEKFNEDLDRIDGEVESSKPSFFGKLIGKKPLKPNYKQIDTKPFVGDFETDLHVWGRPFLIADTEELQNLVRKYINSDIDEAESLAKSQIHLLKSGLEKLITADFQEIPSDETFTRNARWKMDLFRNAYIALFKSEMVQDDEGNGHNPRELFQSEFIFSLVESAALVNPTWMARGYVWPSLLLDQAGAKGQYFQPANSLINDKLIHLDEIEYGKESTISENYSIGAVVPPEALDKFKSEISEYSNAILQRAKEEDWEHDCILVLQKLSECIDFCNDNNMYFVESSDIYSGPLGTIS